MSEIQRRIDNSIKNYSASFMSNTKWRRVLELVGKLDMPVQFAFVREKRFFDQIHFPENGCEETHTKDCTMHGPFYFKEIFAMKCPVFEVKTNPKTGAKIECTQRSDLFLENIKNIGRLPIQIGEEYIHIKGYE